MVNINDSLAVKPKSKRIFYFDALRAMAIIAVIVIHVFSETMVLFKYGQLPFHSGGWLFEDVLGVCFRFGVDLFLMLAGALSLGRDWDIKTFLGKRLPRIVIPFLFWGFVLSSLLLIFTVVFPDFYWLHDQIAAFLSPVGFLKTLYLFYMAKAICSAPYWFFWMILGRTRILPNLLADYMHIRLHPRIPIPCQADLLRKSYRPCCSWILFKIHRKGYSKQSIFCSVPDSSICDYNGCNILLLFSSNKILYL